MDRLLGLSLCFDIAARSNDVPTCLECLVGCFGYNFNPAEHIHYHVYGTSKLSGTIVSVTLTYDQIAQAIAPAFIGTMSDNSGRRLSFIICFIIFIIGNVGLALQTNYVALLVLRMVQAVGGTAAIALVYAVVADIATSAERGKYMGEESGTKRV